MATPIPKNEASFTTFWIAAATGGSVARGDGKAGRGITTDSREVAPGSAFVAIRGENSDGHDYVQSANDRGAAVVVVEKGRGPKSGSADIVEVDDTLRAWGDIARAHLRRWRQSRKAWNGVVAITGSAGKTTTKEICAALLRECGTCHATAGNLNNRLGLPAVALGVTGETDYVVLEMGMNLPGEIAALTQIAAPRVGVITNVGVAHGEGVGGGRDAVAREKGALFENLDKYAAAVVNADDDAVVAQLARTDVRNIRSFGRDPSASYRLLSRSPLGVEGSALVVKRARFKKPLEIILPLAGEAAAIDFVAALAAADAAARNPLRRSAIARAVETLRPPSGRGEIKKRGDGALVIDDSYNANPGSVRASLESAAEIARAERRRLVVVLGEMKELGATAEAEHAALGDAISAAGAAIAIGCGGLVDRALDRVRGAETVKATDTAHAAREAALRVRAGDVVLVKGSRSVATERVVQALMERG